MKIVQHHLKPQEWIKVPVRKHHIVWHAPGFRTHRTPYEGLPGTVPTYMSSWRYHKLKTATPWVIDRDGTVYSTYPDSDWAFHLHVGTVAPDGKVYTNGVVDRMSIGIDIANELDLVEKDGKFYPHGNIKPTNEYTGPTFQKSYRDNDWWADLDPEQVDSLIELTLDCCKRNSIDPVFYRGDNFDHALWEYATILRHCNVNPRVRDLPLNGWVVDKIAAAGIKVVGV